MKKLTVIGLLVVMAGCYNDKADKLYPAQPTASSDPCDTTNTIVTYSGKVRTIMLSNCAKAGCHDAAGQAGGYDLSTYAGVQSAANSGKLLGTMQHATGYSPMPQDIPGKLPDCTIGQVQKWVSSGALNN